MPDEEVHINSLNSYLGYKIEFNDKNNNYGDTTRIIKNYDKKLI